MQVNNVQLPIKDFPSTDLALTPRMQKGLRFEKLIEYRLNAYGFTYEHHDLGSHDRVDFLVFGNKHHRLSEPIQLECKFSHAYIYPSWILRDWIPRFDYEAKWKIVVTNIGMKISEKGKELLKQAGILVITYAQLWDVLISIINYEQYAPFMMGVTSFLEVNRCVSDNSISNRCVISSNEGEVANVNRIRVRCRLLVRWFSDLLQKVSRVASHCLNKLRCLSSSPTKADELLRFLIYPKLTIPMTCAMTLDISENYNTLTNHIRSFTFENDSLLNLSIPPLHFYGLPRTSTSHDPREWLHETSQTPISL